MATEPEKKTGFRIPDWASEWIVKIVPWALMAVIAAGAGLFVDNIGNKRDISREAWRNDKQDVRDDRMEMRQDRLDEAISELRDTQNAFQAEALHRLDILLEKKERRRREQ